jgi:hypothetical protein
MAELIVCANSNRSDRIADVVFVHGLNGDARSTWTNPTSKNGFWPDWLGADFQNVGVWSLSYDVKSTSWMGDTMVLDKRATNILDRLPQYEIGKRPIVFIVHSFGGLVVKKLLQKAHSSTNDSWKKISARTQGIVFLATPHWGSWMANWVRWIPFYFRTVTVSELEEHNPELEKLGEWFRDFHRDSKFTVKVYTEARKFMGFLVVPDGDPRLPRVDAIPLDVDHISITKPKSKDSQLYMGVQSFVQQCLADAAPADRKSTQGTSAPIPGAPYVTPAPEPGGYRVATLIQRWDVTLPTGDIKTTRIFKGLQSATGERVDELEIWGQSQGLIEAHFRVRLLTDSQFRVTKRIVPAAPDSSSGFRCQVAIKPALEGDRSVDLFVQSVTYGSLFSSAEAQRYGRVPHAELGVEGIQFTFKRDCRRFLGNLRLFAPDPWLPENLTLNVVDSQNQPISDEQESGHVGWCYWGPAYSTKLNGDLRLCEAFIDIHRPLLDHQYLLSWVLPETEPIPHRADFDRLRRRLYIIDETAPEDARAFCDSVVEWLRAAMSRETSVTDWNDPHMSVNLFVFDGESRLDFKASSSPHTILADSFRWGEGIVGNAFRRRAPWVVSKLYPTEEGYFRYPVPPHVSVLFALPLHFGDFGVPVGPWPVGVITIASLVEDSRLLSLAEPQQTNARQRLWSNGVHLWHALRDRLL